MKEKLNIVNVIKFAGAYIAFIIGSGFATGQEIMQFYTSQGIFSIGAILVSMFLFAWVGGSVMAIGYDHASEPEGKAYQRFCGKYLGTFYEYFVPFFLFCVVVIMISGAGATLNEYYGLNYNVGCLIMAVLVFAAYIFGLNGLVNVIGFIGPVIIIFTMGIGLVILAKSGGNLSHAAEMTQTVQVAKAAPNWWMSGILYAGYNIFGAIIFLTALGRSAKSRKEAMVGGAVGGIALMTATLVMNLALLANIGEMANLAIPTLSLAKSISPLLGIFFSIVLLCGIFSTAAPMMWTVCDRITKEGTTKSKIIAAVLVIVAFVGGRLPFGTLVGTIYPYTGYLGMLLFLCLAYAQIKKKMAGKKENTQGGEQ